MLAQVIVAAMFAGDAGSPAPTTVALRHATIVDVVGERLLAGQTVVIEGSMITLVAPDASARVPVGAQVIDCTGRFVIPGLWDMHVHVPELWIPGNPAASQLLGWNYLSALLLANGVTGARIPAGNLKRLSEIRADVVNGKSVGPRLILTGQKLGEQPVVGGAPFPINTESDARLSVQLLKRRGADFVKISSALPAPLWRAAADQARFEHLPVVGHVPSKLSLSEAVDLGMSSVEHLFSLPRETSRDFGAPGQERLTQVLSRQTGRALGWLRIVDPPPQLLDINISKHDTTRSRELFGHLRDRGISVTPTLVLTASMIQEQDRVAAAARRRFLTSDADTVRLIDVRAVAPRMYNAQVLAFHLALVRELRDAGVNLLAGSDAPALNVPGYALHDELQLLVRAGLSPAAALRAATSNVGRFLKADSLGVVRRGAVADLVLLNENPLHDITATRRIATVIAAGHVYSRQTLDRMLDSAAAIAARMPRARPQEQVADEAAPTNSSPKPR